MNLITKEVEMNKDENSIFEIAEAVALREALNVYIQKIASEYSHDNENYKNAMGFLSMLYKKYSTIAQTEVEIGPYGTYVIKKSPNLRKDFNAN
jgi:hypothetical protein